MMMRVEPMLTRAIREDPAVAAEHMRIVCLLELIRCRPTGSQRQKAAIVALQVAVQRRRVAYEAWTGKIREDSA